LSSFWEGGKNKSMQLILGRGKGTRACNSFGEECLSLSLLAAFIPLLNEKKGMFGRWTKVVLIPFLGYP